MNPVLRNLSLAACCLWLGACAGGQVIPAAPEPGPARAAAYGGETGKSLNALLSEDFSDTRSLNVIYATNRARGADPAGCGSDAYGVGVSTEVSYGVCRINVPKKHKVGGFEAAPDGRADPHRYFKVMSHTGLTRDELAAQLAGDSRDMLVFVHGFNVKFDEAVLRAAQIAYDLKFQGPVLLFSWPAGAAPGLFGGTFINRTYDQNRANAALSVKPAAGFFGLLAGLNRTSHVMVHSMGHQVVVPALASVAADTAPFIGELVLNAPDIPVGEFSAAAPALRRAARRVTVYCSYNDNAIAASEAYNKNRRMGGCELIDGVDVINVGEIDAPALGIGGLGHGYYASRPILTDIFQLLLGINAPARQFVRRSEVNSTENYYLRQ